jgi:hypothetical protein
MSAVDVRRFARLAWQRVKQSEEVKDDDPALEHIEGRVIRKIVDLEVSRLQRTSSVCPIEGIPKPAEENEDDPTISAVA